MTIKINGTNTTAQPSITGADTDTGLVYGTNEVKIVTDATDRVTVTNTGMGIGTASPGRILDVTSTGSAEIKFTDSTNIGRDMYIKNNNGAFEFRSRDRNSNGTFVFLSYGGETDTERLRILSDGTIATAGLTATPGTVAAGSYIQHSANAGFFGNNGDAKFGSSANNPVLFQVNGSEKARIDTSGRLGINTSSPETFLHIDGSNGAKNIVLSRNGGVSDRRPFGIGISGGSDATLRISCSSDTSGANAFDNQRIDINPGSVLVGTSNTYDGEASSLVVASASNTGITVASTGNNNRCNLYFADGTSGTNSYKGGFTYDHANDSLITRANGAERMRINNLGKMGIMAQANSDALAISSGQSSGTSYEYMRGMYGSTTAYAGTLSFRVFTNGNVENTNNSYSSISDIKLKENIVDASSQWADIKELRVRNYNFIKGQTHTQIGLVAQEVELVSPGLVSESPDRDEDDNDLGTVTKAVNYSVLYMKAVKALQEAMTRIETLETQNASLEARLTALEGGAN